MAKKDIKFTLDTIDSRYSPVGTVKQLDSVFFYIKITENGVTKDLTGQTIKLFAIKEDKKIVEQTTKINITNQREGLVEIELLNAAIQVHGFTYFELEISDSNGIISTSDFILRVNKRVGSNEAIESTNEVATLKKIEEYVAQAKVELQKFKNLQVEMLETNNSINSQEDLRLEAEKSRVDAEKGRVAAETKREEAFSKLEGRITANEEELETARTATTGEKFNSLDERIDCEVDRINKKIEISFLEQEDSENHTIENTVKGMTVDMIVKGKTLQNLLSYENNEDFNSPLNATVSDSIITINASGDVKYVLIKKEKALIKPSTKYTLIIDVLENSINSEGRMLINGISGCFTPQQNIELKSQILVVESVSDLSSKSHLIDSYIEQNATTGTIKYRLMLLEGDYTNKSIPSYFKGIKSLGEQEGKFSILSTNFKNLFNKKNIVLDSYIDSDGSISPSSSGNCVSDFIELKETKGFVSGIPNTLNGGHNSAGISYYDTNKIFIKTEISNNFTKPLNATYIRLTINKKDINTCVLEEKIKIELKKQDKKNILLSEYGFDEGLRGIKNVTDELNSIRNVAIKRIDKTLINGRVDNGNTYIYYPDKRFLINIKKLNINKKNETCILCDKLPCNRDAYSNPGQYGISGYVDSSATFSGRWDFGESVIDSSTFIEYLKANPLTIYYEMAETAETPFFENINLKTFREKTYVNFENALSGTSSFKVPVNAAATISRLSRDNKALAEENLSLRQDLESTTLMLTDSDLELVKQNVDMDFRLMEVEFALDIPQAILSSDINFKNKKGEVKTMARTPYEMMKIVILSGDYDREDYMHKVGKYYERGRMTKEEHDELMSLMTADEVISK